MKPVLHSEAHRSGAHRTFWCALLYVATSIPALTVTLAGSMQWQVVNGGQPIKGGRSAHLNYFASGGYTLFSLGDAYMPPVFWVFSAGQWQRRVDSPAPTELGSVAQAYDSFRQRLVRFGGVDRVPALRDETWEFDGATWLRRVDVGAPPARRDAGLAYDSARHVIVMFGGYGAAGNLNDTWEYDGVLWREVNTPTPRPVPRQVHSMAYDENRGRTVMAFGLGSVPLRDTWEYDGTRWTQAPQPPLSFGGRYVVPMAYDPIRKKIYMFSGVGVGAETRFWTGSQWQLLTTPSSPSARSFSSMTFDSGLGKTLLYGGEDSLGVLLGDTWTFDGTDWQQLAMPPSIAAREYSPMSFDSHLGVAITQGGYDCCSPSGAVVDEPRAWNGLNWESRNGSLTPGRRSFHAAAFDPVINRTVLFGGDNATSTMELGDTWEYDELTQSWAQVTLSGPPARYGHAMAYSSSHGGVIILGGDRDGPRLEDVWVYKDRVWTQVVSSGGPGERRYVAIAYDSWRDQVVLYGGGDGAGPKGDTWVLRGSVWTQIPASGPGLRQEHAMAFDPLRGKTVLMGSGVPTTYDQRTWEFDGANWQPVTTAYTPDMWRFGAGAFWDSFRSVVVLSGGSPNRVNGLYGDTWAYGWDADDDLKVGGYDNCPNTPNPDQLDSDLDDAGNACDCAPADPTTKAIPSEAAGVTVAQFASATRIAWNELAPQAGTSVRYDVSSGALNTFQLTPFAPATCLANALSTAWYDDTGANPAAGDGNWYLVRGETSCGRGSFGVGRAALEGSQVCP